MITKITKLLTLKKTLNEKTFTYLSALPYNGIASL